MTGDQGSLFDDGAPGWFHSDPTDTELEAALAVAPVSGKQRRLVLAALGRRRLGLTDDELATVTGLYRYSAAPRRKELADRELVEDSGTRRDTPHGRRAIVWRITPAGVDALAELEADA